MLRLRDPFVLIGIGAAGVLFACMLLSSLEWPGRTFSGFLVLENRVVASAGLTSWPATHAGIYQAEVVAVDDLPVGSAGELREQVAALEPDTSVRYRFERDGAAFEREVLTRGFSPLDWVLLSSFRSDQLAENRSAASIQEGRTARLLVVEGPLRRASRRGNSRHHRTERSWKDNDSKAFGGDHLPHRGMGRDPGPSGFIDSSGGGISR